jgi:hypothetical protein
MRDLGMQMVNMLFFDYLQDENAPVWKGPAYAFFFLLVTYLNIIGNEMNGLREQNYHHGMRAALANIIYNKLFRMSSSEYTQSNVLSIYEQDMHKIIGLGRSISDGVITPIVFAANLYVLYSFVGLYGSAAAIVSFVFILIFTYLFIPVIRREEEAMRDCKDTTNKYLTELINFIRILKFYNWESVISQKVIEARDNETN